MSNQKLNQKSGGKEENKMLMIPVGRGKRRSSEGNGHYDSYQFELTNTKKTYYIVRVADDYTEWQVQDTEGNKISDVQTKFADVEVTGNAGQKIQKIKSFKFSIDRQLMYFMQTNKYDNIEGYFSEYVVKILVRDQLSTNEVAI